MPGGFALILKKGLIFKRNNSPRRGKTPHQVLCIFFDIFQGPLRLIRRPRCMYFENIGLCFSLAFSLRQKFKKGGYYGRHY
jgi:hypothetical protein